MSAIVRAWGLLALVHCAACSSNAADVPTNNAQLVVGYYTKIEFIPLDTSDDCPVLWGLQGGNWTMPTLRSRRFGPDIVATGTLTMGHEVLGTATLGDKLVDRGDGWQELTYLPIPVTHAPPNESTPIDDIYRQRARLTISVVDQDQQSVREEHDVVLIQSEVTE